MMRSMLAKSHARGFSIYILNLSARRDFQAYYEPVGVLTVCVVSSITDINNRVAPIKQLLFYVIQI